ncbi:MAG: hypothetical protein U0264_03820 [Candidatus Kapaibacterium sp.]
MNTPLEYDEQQPSEEWAKLRHYVSSPKSSQALPDDFEQNVVSKILMSATGVTAPDTFEEEVMRRIAAEAQPAQPQNWERILSALKTRTAAVIGVVALITGSTISIYTVSQQPAHQLVAPLLPKQEAVEMDLSPVRVERDTRFDNVKQSASQKAARTPDSINHPIPGKATPKKATEQEEDF